MHQNSLFRYLYFNSPNCSYNIVLLFPFKYPINLDTEYFGGISNSMCTWSGHISASTIFTPFHSHNFLSIAPIARFFRGKISSSDIWGQTQYGIYSSTLNAINYWYHSFPFWMVPPLGFFLCSWQTAFKVEHLRRVFSVHTFKVSGTTRPTRGFLLHKKARNVTVSHLNFTLTLTKVKDGIWTHPKNN